MLKLEISYRVLISGRILVSFRGFFYKNLCLEGNFVHAEIISNGSIAYKKQRVNMVLVITHWCTGHNCHGNCYPCPNSHATLPQHPPGFILFLKFENHMGCQIKGLEVKGSEEWFSMPWMHHGVKE